MQIIATYWYVWLIIMIIGYTYALFNHLRIVGCMKGENNLADGNLLKCAGKMFVSATIGLGAMVLLLIAIVLHIAAHIG